MKVDIFYQKAERRETGFTFLELILVMTIGLSLIVSGVAFFRQATFSQNLYETSWTVSSVSFEIIERSRNLEDYSSIDNDFILNNQIMPNFFEGNGSNLRHPFGGSLTVGSDAPYDTFWMTFIGLPEAACKRIFDFNRTEVELGRERIVMVELNTDSWDVLSGAIPDVSACTVGNENTAKIYFK